MSDELVYDESPECSSCCGKGRVYDGDYDTKPCEACGGTGRDFTPAGFALFRIVLSAVELGTIKAHRKIKR